VQTPSLEQMINMKLDERTNENKQMDNLLSNIQKHNNYNNKQDIQDDIDLQNEEVQMYRMPMQKMDMNMDMDMDMDMQIQNIDMVMPMQKMPMQKMPMQKMQMQNMDMIIPIQNMQMHNMDMQKMAMRNMDMQKIQNMQMQNMQMQNMDPKQNMYKKNEKNEKNEINETNDLENLKTKTIISYIKNPLIVFFIFMLLNSPIIIQTIDNLLAFCNNDSLIIIINLIIRGLLASLLYIIITNILINI
jgi:hypothetical protein